MIRNDFREVPAHVEYSLAAFGRTGRSVAASMRVGAHSETIPAPGGSSFDANRHSPGVGLPDVSGFRVKVSSGPCALGIAGFSVEAQLARAQIC